jgi:hypothetical protein
MAKRVGRPRARLPRAKHLITHRIRWLVDNVHEGNLNEASRVTGIPYPTLRDLYVGRTTNPSLQTLETLRKPYTMSVEWFTNPKAPERPLLGGIVGYLPPLPGRPRREKWDRRDVVIPYTAWPMYEVFTLLFDWLDKQPSSPDRFIVGDADDREYTERLTTFLLRPYLEIERETGDVNTILPAMPVVPQRIPTDEDEEAWVRKMRTLGLMWQQAIPELLAKARTELAARTAPLP